MKKQSGFTLIELMVVMAIIAILATAGLAAYTGYLKKARDTTRMEAIAALNNIALGMLGSTGLPPINGATLSGAAFAANNNQYLKDPMAGKNVCMNSLGQNTYQCGGLNGYYMYGTCDNGSGFILAAALESSANLALYTSDMATTGNMANYFNMGSCSTPDASGYLYAL